MSKKTILIVDDEENILEVLGTRLIYEGYDVLKADNGRKAIVLARESQPDLIILDIILPDLDGATVAQVLKDDPKTKDIPVIFLSCLISKESAKGEKVIKGKYYIAKPYDPKELMQSIRKHLSD